MLLLLVERFRRDDRADATTSPAGSGGARDVNVPGNGRGAATNNLFAKAMVNAVAFEAFWGLLDWVAGRQNRLGLALLERLGARH